MNERFKNVAISIHQVSGDPCLVAPCQEWSDLTGDYGVRYGPVGCLSVSICTV